MNKEVKNLRERIKIDIENWNDCGCTDDDVCTDVILEIGQWKLLLDYINQLETNRDEAIKLIKSKNNGVCIKNGIEKNAYTFLLDFDEAREFVWELEEILERGKEDV